MQDPQLKQTTSEGTPQGSPCALARKARPSVRLARLPARLALRFVDQISGGAVALKKGAHAGGVEGRASQLTIFDNTFLKLYKSIHIFELRATFL